MAVSGARIPCAAGGAAQPLLRGYSPIGRAPIGREGTTGYPTVPDLHARWISFFSLPHQIKKRIILVYCDLFLMNVGWSFFCDRKRWKLVLIRNPTGAVFITGDQPVINTFATGLDGAESVEDVEFVYPLSPRCALLLTDRDGYIHSSVIDCEVNEPQRYNIQLVKHSHSQVYAASKEDLVHAMRSAGALVTTA